MAIDFTPDPQAQARKQVLDVFDASADKAPIDFKPAAAPAKIDFKPVAEQTSKIDFKPKEGFVDKAKRLGTQLEDDVLSTNQSMVESGVKKILNKEKTTVPSTEGALDLARFGTPMPNKPDKELPYPVSAAVGALNLAAAPEVATVHGLVGKPLERNTGIPAELTDTLALGAAGALKGKIGKVPETPKPGAEPPPGVKPEEPVAPAGTPPEPPKPADERPLPERTSDELFKLKNRDEMRRTQYVQNLKQIKDVPNETWEKLYAYKDNPDMTGGYKLKLSNAKDEDVGKDRPGRFVYRVEDPAGNYRGFVDIDKIENGDARIGDIMIRGVGASKDALSPKNSIGPTELKNLFAQLKAQHPEITTLSGKRVSGIRKGGEELNYRNEGPEVSAKAPNVAPISEGVKLTPEEKALYDKHIAPIATRSEDLLKEFKADGHDFGHVGAAPRRVKDRDITVEKIYGNKPADKPGVRSGRRISTFSPAAQSRTMWALPGKVGQRRIVYVEDGKLFSNGEPVGEIMDKDARPGSGVDTSLGRLQQATTAEVEKATDLEYHKNLLANEYLRAQSLERAKDAKDFIENLKRDPQFLEYATTAGNKEAPASWRGVSGIKEFEGYKFDPHLAENIEDYMGDIKSPEDYTNAVMNVAKATKASIFYNPIRHMVNATNMFLTSKGALGSLRDLPNTPMAFMRAVKSVVTQDDAFRAAAKEGMSLPSMRDTAQQFNQELTRAMGLAIQRDPKGMAQLAKDWGYNSTVGMVKALYKGSGKLLWSYSDILGMTRVNEYMARGLSRAEAIRRTEQVTANYRVPSRVMGMRGVSQFLQDPRVTMFGRYDYNRFANLTGMVKRAFKTDKQAWEARDQLLALAAITTLGYTTLDKWIQSKTGNDQAHADLGGYTKLVDNIKDVAEGKKSVSQFMQATFAPGLFSLPMEVVTGENMYTGKKIAQRADFVNFIDAMKTGNFSDAKDYAARIGFDLTKEIADKFAPVGAADRYFSGDMTPADFWLSQVGVSTPTDEQQAGAEKAQKYMQREGKAAARKRPDSVP